MEATLKLKPRQDLFSLAVGLIFPMDDQLDVEVYMKESDMPQMVLAIATKKLMRAMLKDETGEEGAHCCRNFKSIMLEEVCNKYQDHRSMGLCLQSDRSLPPVLS